MGLLEQVRLQGLEGDLSPDAFARLNRDRRRGARLYLRTLIDTALAADKPKRAGWLIGRLHIWKRVNFRHRGAGQSWLWRRDEIVECAAWRGSGGAPAVWDTQHSG